MKQNKLTLVSSVFFGSSGLSVACGVMVTGEITPVSLITGAKNELTAANSSTFLLIRLMMPILDKTCMRLTPSRGTPSLYVSLLSAPGSHR